MARKPPEEKPDWELSNISTTMFCSLMIILLAFFIMLTTVSVIDESREKDRARFSGGHLRHFA